MSIENWLMSHRPTPERLAAFLGLMLVAWQPFISAARLPSLLLFALGLWMSWRRRISFAERAVRRLSVVFFLLLVPVLLSIPSSLHPSGSIDVALALVLFFVVGLALVQGLGTAGERAWFERWLLIMVLFLVADALLQFAFGTDLFGVPISVDGRILGPFEGKVRLGLFLAVLLPIALWRMAATRPWLALGILALSGMVIGLSAFRSNLVLFLLTGGLLLTRFSWRHRPFVIGGMLIAIVAAVAFSPVLTQRIDVSVEAAGQEEVDTFHRLDKILSGRLTIWETAWRMVRDRPLTGVGAKAFDHAYDGYATRPDDPFRSPARPYHAHQMYVSMAAETGLIGLAGLVAIIGFGAGWYLRAPPERRAAAAPYGASLAAIAFPIQSQPVLFTLWWFPVVVLLLCGFLTALSPRDKPCQGQTGHEAHASPGIR